MTSKSDKKDLRYQPMVFTEQSVAMLSTVLKSERAILANIEIMRVFTRLRNMLAGYEDLKRKIEAIQKKYDKQFRIVFKAITRLIGEDEIRKRKSDISSAPHFLKHSYKLQ